MTNFWDRISGWYDQALSAVSWQAHQLALAQGVQGRLLEVCCGTGALSAALIAQGHNVTTCDLAPRMVQRAQKKASAPGRFLVADVTRLPFASRAFDVTLCTGALGLLKPTQKHDALAEISRVTRQEIRLLEPLERRPGFYWMRLWTFMIDGHRPIPLALLADLGLAHTEGRRRFGGIFSEIVIRR